MPAESAFLIQDSSDGLVGLAMAPSSFMISFNTFSSYCICSSEVNPMSNTRTIWKFLIVSFVLFSPEIPEFLLAFCFGNRPPEERNLGHRTCNFGFGYFKHRLDLGFLTGHLIVNPFYSLFRKLESGIRRNTCRSSRSGWKGRSFTAILVTIPRHPLKPV